MGGGGGAQGTVDFPDYIKAWHHELLSNQADPGFNVDLGGLVSNAVNPYNLDPYYEDPSGKVSFGFTGMTDPGDYYGTAMSTDLEDSPASAVSKYENNAENLYRQIQIDFPNVGIERAAAELASNSVLDEANDRAESAQSISIEADWESRVIEAAEQADLDLNGIDVQALASAARSGSVSQIQNVIAESQPDIDHEQVGGDMIREAVAVADEADSLDTLNWSSIFSAAKARATEEVTAAVTAAKDVVDSQPVQDTINDYRRRIEGQYEDRVGAFAASMADINAVNSSAYAIGLALIRAEHNQDVSQFDTQLSLQLYQQALQLHQDTLRVNIQSKLQTEVTNKQAREQFIQATAEVVSGVYSQVQQLRSIFSRLIQQSYGQRLEVESQAAAQEKQSRDQFIQQGVEAMLNLQQMQEQYKSTVLQLFQDFAKTHIQSQLQVDSMDLQKRRFSKELAYQMTAQYWNTATSARLDTFNQLMSNVSAYQEMHNQYVSSKLNKEARQQMWELDKWEQAANILAAPSGMARKLPEGQSDASGAVGGALSGAGTGASVGAQAGGAQGAAIGAGAGAILGGVSGYFGSQ